MHVHQVYPTLQDPVDCSPPGSSVHGILQARILEWVAMLSSRGSSDPGIKPPCLLCPLHWQVGSLPFVPPGKDPEIYQIWIVNQASKSNRPKETWKKHPIKVIQTAMWVRFNKILSLSLPVCLLTWTVLFFLLINTLLALLLPIFVEILFCKAEEPGSLFLTTGLVARMWCSHHRDPDSISAWKPKPYFKLFQAEATQDQNHHHQSASSCEGRDCHNSWDKDAGFIPF